ncbi:hypothetical protein HWQ46_01755 [Shewanella sp. D64]|uniref:hypothetical protein n=1 Tax=unclassified Shewanella TaxID=196818 RepID=UPI0022BA67AB|nr:MULTISPECIES: hypothetical protein [unclassified Shewanella]MEC4724272.1 hypothetical protein [Shewanella sp. D64]MEC4738784.1 hypothetical protein [Shewanella sp. E94]WBJ97776.1 hypothetical protein HWQ47_12100 [Shewanella sp. MTB7]
MLLEQMPEYLLPTLAAWPQPWYEVGLWQMYELKLCKDGSLKWYLGTKYMKAEVYNSYKLAVEAAIDKNIELSEKPTNLDLSISEKDSLLLKIEKEVTRQSRLFGEEQLMLSEGIRRHLETPRPLAKDIVLPDNCESFLDSLMNILNETPYINFVRLKNDGTSLRRGKGNDWSTTAKHTKQTAKYFYREKIAAAFGLNGAGNWGITKSKIREMLLPRANQLLQLASVKRMLAEAEQQGKKVVVASGYVFWFEESDNVGWIVKEVSYSDAEKSGNILWKKGTILSKNHGRIVVLPYVKDNGEFVQGHTKNAPHDGQAKPRHSKEYVELPYEILNNDLMIGLFGELKYE